MPEKQSPDNVAIRHEMPGVTAGADIFSTMHGVYVDIEAVVTKFGKDPDVVNEAGGADPNPLDTAAMVKREARLGQLRGRLSGLEDRLRLAMEEARVADRGDLLKLLEDPLSSETRATRRNLGVLAALAVLVGTAGVAPASFLGFTITNFRGWEFPGLLAAVIVYEFVAFRLYIQTDLARRKIHYDRARHDRSVLAANLVRFGGSRGGLSPLLLAARGHAPAIVQRFDALASRWGHEVETFSAEFRAQDSRRVWDVHVPTFLFAVSVLALLSMLRAWRPVAAWLSS